jgi:hypothetical protein
MEETAASIFRMGSTHYSTQKTGSRILRNTGKVLPGYTVTFPKRKILQVTLHQNHRLLSAAVLFFQKKKCFTHVLNIFSYLEHFVVTRLKEAMLMHPTQAHHFWPGETGAWRGLGCLAILPKFHLSSRTQHIYIFRTLCSDQPKTHVNTPNSGTSLLA